MKTIILDFVGVVADINKRNLISNLSIKQKISALRIYASRKKHPIINNIVKAYQKGLIDALEVQTEITKVLPNCSYVVPFFLESLKNNIRINPEVLNLIKQIQNANVQVLAMSNSIPETEDIMLKHNLDDIFDGIILSTELGYMKPEPEIYKYAINKYGLNLEDTLMIDDTEKNLRAANSLGISTMKCKNTKETCEVLNSYIKFLKNTHQL